MCFLENAKLCNENDDVLRKKSRGSQRTKLLLLPIDMPSQELGGSAVSNEERGLSSDLTDAVSRETEEGWTLVTPKRSQTMATRDGTLRPSKKSGAQNNDLSNDHERFSSKNNQVQNRKHSLSNSTNGRDTSRLRGSNESSFGDRAECRPLKSKGDSDRGPKRGDSFNPRLFTENAGHLQQTPVSKKNIGEIFQGPYNLHQVTANQDAFHSLHESSSPSLATTNLTCQSGPPCHPVLPCTRQTTNERRFDLAGSTSLWESLEKISAFKMVESLNLDHITESSSLSVKSQIGSNPGITTEVSNLRSNVSQGRQEILPKGVVRLCQHYVNDQKTPSCCFSCSKNSKSRFEYGIWRSTERKWQLIRPYPRDVKFLTPFRICWHYSNGSECVPSCKFAHGEEELNLWSTRRQAGKTSIAVPSMEVKVNLYNNYQNSICSTEVCPLVYLILR